MLVFTRNSLVFIMFISAGFSSAAMAKSINVKNLKSAPRIDGSAKDWSGVPATTLKLKNPKPGGKSKIKSVSVKSGVYGNKVYFLFKWKDDSKDIHHKPYVWNSGKGKYVKGKQREDRLAIQFAMKGNYSTNWLSGKTFTADTWHWKAARSNPAGVAHDKRTIISTSRQKKSFKTKAENGKTIYIRRPSDSGPKLYKTKRYRKYKNDIMPKYIINKKPTGSIADVKAKAVWSNGTWTLEMSRVLNTGNHDDIVFRKGKTVKAGLAIFNHSGDNDHNNSEMIKFRF